MKKSFSFLVVVLALIFGCEEHSFQTSPKNAQAGKLGSSNPSVSQATLSGCTPMSGSQAYAKTGDYNCHQYIRGALVQHQVDLNTGQPNAVNFGNLSSSTIQQDPNFIRVCNRSDAKAIAHLPMSMDHSTLIVSTYYTYSFPGGTYIYSSGSPLNYGTACDYEYYAAIPDVTVQGPTIVGSTYKFTLANKSNYPFILTDNLRWTYSTSQFNEVSRTDTELVISPKAGVTGSFTVSAAINTSASKNPTGACAYGVNGQEVATQYTPVKTNNFSVTPDCGGKLDGNTLYTVNTVTRGVQHTVIMNAPSWTWVKTGGNATWYGYGNQLTFTISSGYATFNAYGSGCNLNLTFYAN